MLIRNAGELDFLSCVGIAARAWPSFKERESIYHLFCKYFSKTCFICEREEAIRAFLLGFLSQVNTKDAYIHLVAVDPDYQRQGLAGRLYQRFFEVAFNLNARRVRLIVNPDNIASLAFHQKFGFQNEAHGDVILINEVLAVRDYNGPGIHMVPLCRKLP